MRPIDETIKLCRRLSSTSHALSKALSISAINQITSSGTNFLLGIYLVRNLSTNEFGAYGIAFAICLLYSGICNALFITQMVVRVPEKLEIERLPYATRTLILLTIFCIATSATLTVLYKIWSHWSQDYLKYETVALPMLLMTGSYTIKDFFIRHSYTVRKEVYAVWINVCHAMILLILLLLITNTGQLLALEIVIYTLAIGNTSGIVLALILFKLPMKNIQLKEINKDIQDSWRNSLWALGGVGAAWGQTQAYMYISAAAVGPAGVAYANAAKLIVTPAMFFIPALNQVMMPRFASLRAEDPKRMIKIGRIFSVSITSFSIVYSIIALSASDMLTQAFIGNSYENLAPLIAAWCLVMIFQFLRTSSSVIMQVLKHFRTLTLINVLSAAIAIVTAIALVPALGVSGTILGTATGELILTIFIFRAIANFSKTSCK